MSPLKSDSGEFKGKIDFQLHSGSAAVLDDELELPHKHETTQKFLSFQSSEDADQVKADPKNGISPSAKSLHSRREVQVRSAICS